MKLSSRGTIRIKMPARRATSGVMWAMVRVIATHQRSAFDPGCPCRKLTL
jgi:hypothetical protein